MQKFIAEQSFWDLFPDASIGILVVRNMKTADEITAADREVIVNLLRTSNAQADQYLESNTISENSVVAIWRDAYRRFKTKKGVRCSLESLLKRVLKGNPVGSITPSVDLYNALSLKYAFPVGGEDVDSFVGNVRLGITEGGDAFQPIGEDADDPTLAGELCYRDDAGAICRCFNWRDGVRTALQDDSRNAILITENLDPARRNELDTMVDEFARLLQTYFGAEIVAREIIDRDNPEMIIVP
ncbi:uncharacterized conserved protein [Cryptobacterium curtum DSM 15641]|uniref:Uncharacterized conserved protein n=1 Tax=Cryptobacterium curtum (strain ATCC 700683 / DSM 15641 / CCUG 43107 / 12-3) TaxID=469378 RepID=C7MN75_CRYCD|nr:phenylalanine--tRNA ligase beta subunit-related protein [Cryptobacterium curtum]ACU94365.1 uncharacterized conserved protein [Cryptobacterium curtum DSM 15641]